MRKAVSAIVLALVLALTLACSGGDSGGDRATPAVLVGGAPTGSPSRSNAATSADLTDQATPEPSRAPKFVSLDWLAADVSVPELPATLAAPVPDPGLQAAIAASVQGVGAGKYSVVVRNLADGRYAALSESEVYYAASLFKAALLLEAYRQRDAGELDFSEVETLKEEYAANDLSTLGYLGLQAGDTLTLGDAIKAMIIVSDTPNANLVEDRINGSRVDATLRALGATTMTVNSHDLPTTAADMARLVTAIAVGDGVTDASRREMLSLMAQEWFGDGIRASVPEGTVIAHKSGSYTDATHDVGVVWSPAGPYVIAVLTDRSSNFEAVRTISRAVWAYFEGHPQ